jgi:hypothetical protein
VKIVIYNSGEFLAFASGLAQKNEWPVSISYTFGLTRSISQNALFWMWMTQLSKYLIKGGRSDSSPDFCHDLMCNTFLGCEVKVITNAITGDKTEVTSIIGTSKLKKGEFTYFLDQIYSKCIDWGLVLTIPSDSEFKSLMERQSD